MHDPVFDLIAGAVGRFAGGVDGRPAACAVVVVDAGEAVFHVRHLRAGQIEDRPCTLVPPEAAGEEIKVEGAEVGGGGGDAAAFLRAGEAAFPFPPGRHVLDRAGHPHRDPHRAAFFERRLPRHRQLPHRPVRPDDAVLHLVFAGAGRIERAGDLLEDPFAVLRVDRGEHLLMGVKPFAGSELRPHAEQRGGAFVPVGQPRGGVELPGAQVRGVDRQPQPAFALGQFVGDGLLGGDVPQHPRAA